MKYPRIVLASAAVALLAVLIRRTDISSRKKIGMLEGNWMLTDDGGFSAAGAPEQMLKEFVKWAVIALQPEGPMTRGIFPHHLAIMSEVDKASAPSLFEDRRESKVAAEWLILAPMRGEVAPLVVRGRRELPPASEEYDSGYEEGDLEDEEVAPM